MRRFVLITIILVLVVSLSAISQKFPIKENELTLEFENIQIKDIEFIDGNVIAIEHSEKDVVEVTQAKGKLIIGSDYITKIELKLPIGKLYVLEEDGDRLEFNESMVSIIEDEKVVIEFRDGRIFVTDDGETVEIGADGIIINDDDGHVEISSRGIIVDTPDEQQHITGFWGQLLGGAINFVTKHTIGWIGSNPGMIVKHIVNDNHNSVQMGVNFSGDNKFTKEIYKTFDPKRGCKLNINNKNGKVIIKSWQEDHIDILAVLKSNKSEKEFDKIDIEITDDDGCTINTKFLKKYPEVSVNYEIQVPENVEVNYITSSNGGIYVENCSGNMHLRTSNGSIEVTDSNGSFVANSSNGSILFKNLKGIAEAHTSNGIIQIEQTPGFKKGVTSNGKIKLKMDKELEDNIYLSTSNGTILITLDPDLDLNIEATTSNADIDLVGLEIVTYEVSNQHLKGKLNKGGNKIIANTSNGKIKFYKLEK